MTEKYKFNPFTGTLDKISVETVPTIPVTTKGDLFTFDTASARLPVGADGRYLEADAAEATGIKWGTITFPSMGGLYGINIETLAANKTLTPGTDEIYQYLDEGGADRTITLDTASATAGDRFVIRHNGHYQDTHYLLIRQGITELDKLYASVIGEYIYDGTNWVSNSHGSGENDGKTQNLGIGYSCLLYTSDAADE